jgi:hypothetical protein
MTTFPCEQTCNRAPSQYKSGASLLELQDSITKQLQIKESKETETPKAKFHSTESPYDVPQ